MRGDPTGGDERNQPARLAQRKRAVVWDCLVAFAAYAIDGLFLALFAFAGTVSWTASLLCVLPGLVVCTAVAGLALSGRSLRFKDPRLTIVLDAVALITCLCGMALFPEVGFIFAMAHFFVLLTATYRIPIRQVATQWLVLGLAGGAVAVYAGDAFTIPQANAVERFISWIGFSASLGRCGVVILLNISINLAIGTRGKQMAATLEQIERLANHDELTGVLNRRSLMRVLDEEKARSARTSAPLSLALLDIDHFKSVNDSLGHSAGDKALVQFAQEILRLGRASDRFGRYGGEEFLLVMADTDLQEAQHAVERMRESLATADWSGIAPDFKLAFSAGVACWRPGEDIAETLRHADQALYAAKDGGRNCTKAWPADGDAQESPPHGPSAASQRADIPPAQEALEAQATAAPGDSAQQTRQRLLKRTRFHLTFAAMVLVSYCVDAAFLWMLSPPESQGWRPALGYAAMGATLTCFFSILIASGWTWRFKDINITNAQCSAAAVIQLIAMALWPHLSVLFLSTMFTVFVVPTARLSFRSAAAIWAFICAGVAVTAYAAPVPAQLPGSGPMERVLLWTFVMLTLGRCVWLGSYNAGLRGVLKKRGVELAQLTAKLRHVARHDELTGALNRRSLLEALRGEQQRADRSNIPLSVAILDLDHFKAVNDKLGHLAGDKALKTFAACVQKQIRGTDTFGRYGGEEFLLIFFNTPPEAAQSSLERLRRAVKECDWREVSADFKLNFSAGFSAYRDRESAEELLRRADLALYRAKAEGRDCARQG